MYLMMLNEKEKQLFLELAYNLANADGDYSSYEKSMIAAYGREMMCFFDGAKEVRNVETIIDVFAEESSEQTKKILVFEMIGLALVDGSFDVSERKIISSMSEKFGLANSYYEECESLLNDYFKLQNRVNDLVIG